MPSQPTKLAVGLLAACCLCIGTAAPAASADDTTHVANSSQTASYYNDFTVYVTGLLRAAVTSTAYETSARLRVQYDTRNRADIPCQLIARSGYLCRVTLMHCRARAQSHHG